MSGLMDQQILIIVVPSLPCAFLPEPYMAAVVSLTSQKNLIFRSNEPMLWGYVVLCSWLFFFFFKRSCLNWSVLVPLHSFISPFFSSFFPKQLPSVFGCLKRESLLMQESPCLPVSVLSCFHPWCSWIYGLTSLVIAWGSVLCNIHMSASWPTVAVERCDL